MNQQTSEIQSQSLGQPSDQVDQQALAQSKKKALIKKIIIGIIVSVFIIVVFLLFYFLSYSPSQEALRQSQQQAASALAAALAANQQANQAAQTSAGAQQNSLTMNYSGQTNQSVQIGQSSQSAGQSAGQSVGQSAGQSVGQSAGQSVGQSAGQSVGQSAGQIPPPPPPPSIANAVATALANSGVNAAAQQTADSISLNNAEATAAQAAQVAEAQRIAKAAQAASIAAAYASTQSAQTAATTAFNATQTAFDILTTQLTSAYKFVGGCLYAVFANATPSTPSSQITTIFSLLTDEQQSSAISTGQQNPLMSNILTQYHTIKLTLNNMAEMLGNINTATQSAKVQTQEDAAHTAASTAQNALQQISALQLSTVKQINIALQLITPALSIAIKAIQTNAAATLNNTTDNNEAALSAANAQTALLQQQQSVIAANNTDAVNAANAAAVAAAVVAAEHIAKQSATNATKALAVAQATAAANAAAISIAAQNIQLAQTNVSSAYTSAVAQNALLTQAINGAAIYIGICGAPAFLPYPFSIANAIALYNNTTTGGLLDTYNNLSSNQQRQALAVGAKHPFIPQCFASQTLITNQIATLKTTSEGIDANLATAKSTTIASQAQAAAQTATIASNTAAAASASITSALNALNTGLQNTIPIVATAIQNYLTAYTGPLNAWYFADDNMVVYQNGQLMANNGSVGNCSGVLVYALDAVTSGDVISFVVQNVGGSGGLAVQWQWGRNWLNGAANDEAPKFPNVDSYIGSPAMFSGSSGSTTKYITNSSMTQGMPVTAYWPGNTTPANLSTFADKFIAATPVYISSMVNYGMCTPGASTARDQLKTNGAIYEQGQCQFCYVAFNWNVPHLPLEPTIPFLTVMTKTAAYIASLNNPPPAIPASKVTSAYSGTLGADNYFILYRNGQIVVSLEATMTQYYALAGVATSGDVFDFVVQNTGGPGCLILNLAWNGKKYYTGTMNDSSNLFLNSPYTTSIQSPQNFTFPPYQQLAQKLSTSTLKWANASGAGYGKGGDVGKWVQPFPGSDPIWDPTQPPHAWTIFRWVVPSVTASGFSGCREIKKERSYFNPSVKRH
jgi:hypothetical protein